MARRILTKGEYKIYEPYTPVPTYGSQIPYRELILGTDPVEYLETGQKELHQKELKRLRLRKKRLRFIAMFENISWPEKLTKSYLQPRYACDQSDHFQYCHHPGLCFEERLYKELFDFYLNKNHSSENKN